MAKTVWLTWMPAGEDAPSPQESLANLQKVGFAAAGALWADDLEKYGWFELGGHLADPEGAEFWVIAGRRSDLEAARGRYALSLISAMVHSLRAAPPQVVVVGLDFPPAADALPMLLRSAMCIDGQKGNWGAKLLVAAHGKKPKPVQQEFRFNVLAHQYMGQWFEVGPRASEWKGAMFGVTGEGAVLKEHAVGPINELPERTTLEYPTHGIKAEVGGSEYEACAVQNSIDPEHSYWVQVEGHPTKLIVGAHPGSEDQEVWVLELV